MSRGPSFCKRERRFQTNGFQITSSERRRRDYSLRSKENSSVWSVAVAMVGHYDLCMSHFQVPSGGRIGGCESFARWVNQTAIFCADLKPPIAHASFRTTWQLRSGVSTGCLASDFAGHTIGYRAISGTQAIYAPCSGCCVWGYIVQFPVAAEVPT
jgi:hypothetical protein